MQTNETTGFQVNRQTASIVVIKSMGSGRSSRPPPERVLNPVVASFSLRRRRLKPATSPAKQNS